jgi:hypothetical protein
VAACTVPARPNPEDAPTGGDRAPGEVGANGANSETIMLCTLCFLAGAIAGIILFIIVANMIIEG